MLVNSLVILGHCIHCVSLSDGNAKWWNSQVYCRLLDWFIFKVIFQTIAVVSQIWNRHMYLNTCNLTKLDNIPFHYFTLVTIFSLFLINSFVKHICNKGNYTVFRSQLTNKVSAKKYLPCYFSKIAKTKQIHAFRHLRYSWVHS